MSGLWATFENKDKFVNSWWWHTAYGGEHTQHCARFKVCISEWFSHVELSGTAPQTVRKLLILRFLRELFFPSASAASLFCWRIWFSFLFFRSTTKVQETFVPNASLSRRIKLFLDSDQSRASRLIINAHVQRNNFPFRRLCSSFFVSASDKLESLPKRKLENGAIYVRRMWMLPLTRINFLV